jgi:hypothetical protein
MLPLKGRGGRAAPPGRRGLRSSGSDRRESRSARFPATHARRSVPIRREELVVACVDERRRDVGMFGERIVPGGEGSGSQTLGQPARCFPGEPGRHCCDRGVWLPHHPAVGVFGREREPVAEDRRCVRGRLEGAEPRTELDEKRRVTLSGHERRLGRSDRVPDNDDRVRNVREGRDCGARALFVARGGVVEGQIRREYIVASRVQALDERSPAGAVVPVAVDQTKGGHTPYIAPRDPTCKPPGRAGAIYSVPRAAEPSAWRNQTAGLVSDPAGRPHPRSLGAHRHWLSTRRSAPARPGRPAMRERRGEATPSCHQSRVARMEPFWSPGVATGGNRRQMPRGQNAGEQAKTVAVDCNHLPGGFHGKEGVDGSSPSEGFTKSLQKGTIFLSD